MFVIGQGARKVSHDSMIANGIKHCTQQNLKRMYAKAVRRHLADWML
jgi:hypothetical protein